MDNTKKLFKLAILSLEAQAISFAVEGMKWANEARKQNGEAISYSEFDFEEKVRETVRIVKLIDELRNE